MYFNSLLASLAAAQLVAGHGAIIKAVGDMGGNGTAIGIDASTPRDGSKRNPFQGDSTRFKNQNADACGETVGGGPNDPATGVAKVVQESGGMPMISAGGMIMMTLHQVNGDGAGPYDCMIDSTGTGTGGWTKMQVATNVPGKNSRSRAKAQDFPLSAKVAADQTCTGSMGGMDNVCMVRCNNKANAGPFGGCVPVQMAGAGAGTGAGTGAGAGAGGASNNAAKDNKAGNADATKKDNKVGNADATANDNKAGNADATAKDNKAGNADATKKDNKAGNTDATAKDNKAGNADTAAKDNKAGNADATANDNKAGNADTAAKDSKAGNAIDTGKANNAVVNARML